MIQDSLLGIRDLYAYDRWANARILHACDPLTQEELDRDLGSSFPSVRETLVHLFQSHWIWLERWKGGSPESRPVWDVSSVPAIRAQWERIDSDLVEVLNRLDEAGLSRVLHYRDLRGNAYSAPMWQLLRHVPNHAAYHRGQVVTMLRQLGHTATNTDMVTFHRLQNDAGSVA